MFSLFAIFQDFSVECGICYSYRLGDEIPDQACDDPRCGQPFHHSCLYEVKTGRQKTYMKWSMVTDQAFSKMLCF